MKNIPICIFGALAWMNLSSSAQAAPVASPQISAEVLALSCLEAGLSARDRSTAASRIQFARGPDIRVGDGYVINVYFFNDDTGNLVGILEKGTESAETAHIKTICLNKNPHPPKSGNEGEFEFTSHLGKKLNILFHLNKKAGDNGYLGHTSWRSPASDSTSMTGPYTSGQTPVKPVSGQYPACLDPKTIKVSGTHNENLSFDFDKCLAPGTGDLTYVYNLYLVRTKNDLSTETYTIDPQLINHGH
jgi:hypothetical protein